MPPLLTEYWPNFVPVVVHSLPSAEEWPIWLSAAATLAGSFGGAWLAGRFAYRSTTKANNALLKRQKLEEALTVVLAVKEPIESMQLSTVESYLIDSQEDKDERMAKALKKIDLRDIQRLETLLKVYGDCLAADANALYLTIDHLQSQVRGSKLLRPNHTNFKEASLTCCSYVEGLERKLVSRLKL